MSRNFNKQILSLIKSLACLLCFVTTTLAQQPNVLILCVDDLRPELNCFGVDYIHSPNIDALAKSGMAFSRHYVQSPSCGPSRIAMLTGRYERQPSKGNGALVARACEIASGKQVPDSMPRHFRKQGYTTVSVGKVSHHPGGLFGKRWKDPAKIEMPNDWDRHLCPAGTWEDPEGVMHGLANGSRRTKGGAYTNRSENDITLFEAVQGSDATYPDGLIVDEGLKQLDELWDAKNEKPFFLVVGVIRPHLPFGAPKKYLDFYAGKTLPPVPHFKKPDGKTTWHKSGEFMKYQRAGNDPRTDVAFNDLVRKHYAACVSYADANVGRILDRLKELDPDNETIVVLWGDHGFHLGEHHIWGKHALFDESLRSPLIIRAPNMKNAGATCSSITESVDLFPTLCELTGLKTPNDLSGESLTTQFANPETPGRAALGYRGGNATLRTESHRLITHGNNYFELYDHQTEAGETANIANQHPVLVKQLADEIKSRLKYRKKSK